MFLPLLELHPALLGEMSGLEQLGLNFDIVGPSHFLHRKEFRRRQMVKQNSFIETYL